MTISRNVGGAKESSRNTSRARGNSTAKDVKQPTSPSKASMEALSAALDGIEVRHGTGVPCGIYRLCQVLPKDVADKVLLTIDTSNHTAVQISLTLDKFREDTGIRITSWIVQKHRRRLRNTTTGCSCLREIGKA
jgi:hypothetical protein